MDGLTVGQLAKQGGVNLQTIRYYERRGILPKPQRSPSGYRVFPGEAVLQVRFVKQAQSLGFSLKEIEELLGLRIDPPTPKTCDQVRQRAEVKVSEVDEKMRGLRAMRKALTRLIDACHRREPSGRCPILEALDSDVKPTRTPKRK